MLTLEELKEKLARVEECELVDRLGLTSEDIVELAEVRIEERFEQLAEEFEDDEEDEG